MGMMMMMMIYLVLTLTVIGSVTLKRIGFFCFPIKHSTHTPVVSTGPFKLFFFFLLRKHFVT